MTCENPLYVNRVHIYAPCPSIHGVWTSNEGGNMRISDGVSL